MNLLKLLFTNTKKWIALSVILSVVSAFSSIGMLSMINNSIEGDIQNILANAGYFLGLVVLLFLTGVVSQAALTKIGHQIVYRLRMLMVKRVIDTSIERIESIGAHRVYAVLTKDINVIGKAFNKLPVVMYNAILVLGGMLFLAYLSIPFFFVTIGVTVLAIAVDRYIGQKMIFLLKQVREEEDKLYKQYEGVIDGRNELKLDADRRYYLYNNLLNEVTQSCRDKQIRSDYYWAVNMNLIITLIFILIGTITFLGTSVMPTDLEVLVGFVITIMFLRTPLTSLVDTIPDILAGKVALYKIQQLSFHAYEPDMLLDVSKGLPEPTQFTRLQLHGITYTYPGKDDEYHFCLTPINLIFKPGEIVFFVGGNGSGKSTFAKLLTGLYQPHNGHISVDGRVIDEQNIEWYRAFFSAVFCDFYLFDRVVGRAGNQVADSTIQYYLEKLQIAHKVSVSQGQFSSTDLSQGQRKRLALLMAYVADRPIILLDEWAADQDPQFRKVFYTELLPEFKRQGKTIVAITHDDHYFHMADRIYRFDAGELTDYESSSVEELATDSPNMHLV